MSVRLSAFLLGACTLHLRDEPTALIRCATQDECRQGFICHERYCVDPTLPADPGVRVTVVGEPRTSETGGVVALSISLLARPSAPVTLGLSVNDDTEARLSALTVTITPEEWDTPKSVAVAGQPDCLADGDTDYIVTVSPVVSDDEGYAGIDPDDLVLTNTDDTAGSIAISAPVAETIEGSSATILVQLGCAPSADVVLHFGATPATEASVSPQTLVIARDTWDQVHAVTVSGLSDCQADGDQPYAITVAPAESADAGYAGIDPSDVAMLNRDSSQIALVVTSNGSVTDEDGLLARFNVRLPCNPQGTVTVTAASSNIGEGLVACTGPTGPTCALAFDAANWEAFQAVDVHGADDDVDDAISEYALLLESASSNASFDGLSASFPLFNGDNDVAGFSLSTQNISAGEDGVPASFNVRLVTRPISDVTITLSTGVMITLTPLTWSTGVDVNVTYPNNTSIGFNAPDTITMTSASADPNYDARTLPAVTVAHPDDDKYLFATSTGYTGALGSVGSADLLCASPPSGYPTGTYKAFLAVGGTREKTLSGWVLGANVSYWRIGNGLGGGGAPVFVGTTAADRFFVPPLSAGLYDPPSGEFYWTGMGANGMGDTSVAPPGYTCNAWGSADGASFGQTGDTEVFTDYHAFTGGGSNTCNQAHRLVCVQQ